MTALDVGAAGSTGTAGSVPLFVTDLDGTLLRSNASLSEYSLEVLSEALARGHMVTFATARSYTSAMKVVSAVPWKYPILLYNGALLMDPLTRTIIAGNWLSSQTGNEILEMGKQQGLLPLLFALDAGDRERVLHEQLTRSGDVGFLQSRPGDTRFAQVDRLVCPDDHKALMLTYIGTYDELANLRERLVGSAAAARIHLNFQKDGYLPDQYFLEVSHPHANKGDGLRLLAERLGMDPVNFTVFGDNLNDLGMFELAGAKLAVANAHADLKRLATQVIGSNDEDGVAAYIARLVGGAGFAGR
jgi:Cof subfamily protein (haloacid dehalogenase superfamily)